jgi:hypothetical protein
MSLSGTREPGEGFRSGRGLLDRCRVRRDVAGDGTAAIGNCGRALGPRRWVAVSRSSPQNSGRRAGWAASSSGMAVSPVLCWDRVSVSRRSRTRSAERVRRGRPTEGRTPASAGGPAVAVAARERRVECSMPTGSRRRVPVGEAAALGGPVSESAGRESAGGPRGQRVSSRACAARRSRPRSGGPSRGTRERRAELASRS